MFNRLYSLLALLLLTACASPGGQWASYLDEQLYVNQLHYSSLGRDDVACYIGVREGGVGQEVICTYKNNIPADAILQPRKANASAYVPATGGRVQVRGYYRKDGTYVRPHTRSAPRRK